jgi:hypothetical protein
MSGMIELLLAETSRAAKARTKKISTSDLTAPDRQPGWEKRDPPMSGVLTNANNPSATASPNRQERRQTRRAGVKMPVRLRPADLRDQKFEEVLATLNASRANLYVVSNSSKYYYKQMRLRITFPFDSTHDSTSMSEDTAEIVRLDHMVDGRVGIALQFQRPMQASHQNNATGSHSAGQPTRERRLAVRQAVSASAKVTEVGSKTDLQGRCSDMSVAGCYIDTLNPFPQGSSVRVQLSNEHRSLEVDAHVITNHMGMGMGLIFDGIGPEKTLLLADWLTNPSTAPLLVVEQTETSEQLAAPEPEGSGSSDRALIVKLLRLLESNGKLAPAEISAILSESKTA